MTTCIALLRGVNVGGHRMVSMADLKAVLTDLGFVDVHSLLQSGNLYFRSRTADAGKLERLLETEVTRRLTVQTQFFVCSADEWRRAVDANPFPREAQTEPGRLLAMFLKHAPSPAAVSALKAAIPGMEKVRVEGRVAYVVYPEGVGRSRLTNAVIEKKLQTAATGRNWNTVQKLAALTAS